MDKKIHLCYFTLLSAAAISCIPQELAANKKHADDNAKVLRANIGDKTHATDRNNNNSSSLFMMYPDKILLMVALVAGFIIAAFPFTKRTRRYPALKKA